MFALWADVGLGQPADRAQVRPNIVFVLTDDQMPGTENRTQALQNNLVSSGVECRAAENAQGSPTAP